MSTDDTTDDSSTDDSGGHCSTPDSDGEVAEEIAIISFGRKLDTAEEIVEGIGDRYETIDIIEYHGDVFAEHWGEYDCFVGLMSVSPVRKTWRPSLLRPVSSIGIPMPAAVSEGLRPA